MRCGIVPLEPFSSVIAAAADPTEGHHPARMGSCAATFLSHPKVCSLQSDRRRGFPTRLLLAKYPFFGGSLSKVVNQRCFSASGIA